MPHSVVGRPRLPLSKDVQGAITEAQNIAIQRLKNSVRDIANPEQYPCYGTEELQWQLRGSEDWTSGFYPGCLWLGYALSNDLDLAEAAKAWTNSIEREKNNTESHDLGFRFICTYGNQLRYDPTVSIETVRSIILESAATMANRFDAKIGALSSNWDRWEDPRKPQSLPVVIDIMMNLELLFWAAENGGPSEYAEIAKAHAHTTWRDFVREDHGTYHVVRYEQSTGQVLDKGQLQGDQKESTWSRGHAWAIYGYVVCYRFIHDSWYLERAELLADYFLDHLPQNLLAQWDFQSEIKAKDVSASAIVCSALFELGTLHPDQSQGLAYEKHAIHLLNALSQPPALAQGDTPCILDLSTQYLPLGQNIDRPSIFADYYYLEALLRYRK